MGNDVIPSDRYLPPGSSFLTLDYTKEVPALRILHVPPASVRTGVGGLDCVRF